MKPISLLLAVAFLSGGLVAQTPKEAVQRNVGTNTLIGTLSGVPVQVATVAALRLTAVTSVANNQLVATAGYYSDGDGGGGIFRYNSASSSADNGGSIIAPTVGSGRWLLVAQQPMNARQFGAKGDGSTNDRTSVAALFASGASDIYFSAGSYNIGSSGVTVPSTVKRLIMVPGAYFTYTGTGVCVDIAANGGVPTEYEIGVNKTVADWDPMTGTGTDVTSIGVRLNPVAFARLTLTQALNFWTGLKINGDGGGVQLSQVHVQAITNCKIGLRLQSANGGWCNQNIFSADSINISSGHTAKLSGTRYVDLIDGNGNTFIGCCLQGDMAERMLNVTNGNGNIFINNRFEGGTSGSIYFAVTSSYNQTIGGYFDAGNYDIITNLAASNVFTGASGMELDADVAKINAFQIRNGVTGRNYFSVARKTTYNGAVTLGNSVDKPTVQMFGALYRTEGANISIQANGDLTTGTDGNYFVNNTGGGATLKGIYGINWSYGSVITLGSSWDITIKHNTASGGGANFKVIKLNGSADFAMHAGGTLTLIYSSSDYWVEIGRMNP